MKTVEGKSKSPVEYHSTSCNLSKCPQISSHALFSNTTRSRLSQAPRETRTHGPAVYIQLWLLCPTASARHHHRTCSEEQNNKQKHLSLPVTSSTPKRSRKPRGHGAQIENYNFCTVISKRDDPSPITITVPLVPEETERRADSFRIREKSEDRGASTLLPCPHRAVRGSQ